MPLMVGRRLLVPAGTREWMALLAHYLINMNQYVRQTPDSTGRRVIPV